MERVLDKLDKVLDILLGLAIFGALFTGISLFLFMRVLSTELLTVFLISLSVTVAFMLNAVLINNNIKLIEKEIEK